MGENQGLLTRRQQNLAGLIGSGLIGDRHMLCGDQYIAIVVKLLQNGGEFRNRQGVPGVVSGVVVIVKSPRGIGNEGLEGDKRDLPHIRPGGEGVFGCGIVCDGVLDCRVLSGAGTQEGDGSVIVVLRGQVRRLEEQGLILILRGIHGVFRSVGFTRYGAFAGQIDKAHDEGNHCRQSGQDQKQREICLFKCLPRRLFPPFPAHRGLVVRYLRIAFVLIHEFLPPFRQLCLHS